MKTQPLDLRTLKEGPNGQRFPVGTTFTPRGKKHAQLCTVTDFLVTTNLAGRVVKTSYVATHVFFGQVVGNSEICDTTIALGDPQLPAPEPSW